MLFDPQKQPQVRNFGWQQIQYLRATINYNDPNITAGVRFARLPANAFITQVLAYVVTAFNAGTTNPVSVGITQASANEIVAAIPGQTAGFQPFTAAAGLGLAATAAGDTDVWCKYAPTGTAATAGQIVVVIAFILNNDQ